jgi:CubicO group peptidase (beta-lactamase class C family)
MTRLASAATITFGVMFAVAPLRDERAIREALALAHIPGASVLVARKGAVALTVDYGVADVDRNVPVSGRSRFQIGSISKQFTAVAMLQLAEQGRIHLDDAIGKYITRIPDGWQPITIRHLLAHTSGLWDWESDSAFSFGHEYSDQEFIDYIGAHPTTGPPGRTFSYTNSGYPILGMILRQVTGDSFESYVRRNILRPAGMSETDFVNGDARDVDAIGYKWDGGHWTRGVASRPQVLAPNGGIVSTAADMLKWDAAVGGGRLLSRDSLQTMWSPVRTADKSVSPYGLGWFVLEWWNHRVMHHVGETAGGFSSSYARFPDDELVIIVLTNVSAVEQTYDIARAIAEGALK